MRRIAVFCIITIFSGASHVCAQSKKPNIILILADDLGYETLRSNGGKSYETPNLDKLAASGVRFTKAYAMPLCTPSRVQLMTGKYNFRNYVRFEYLDTLEHTFANYLRDGGYQTCIAGKWQLGGSHSTPAHFGFENYCLWQLKKTGYFSRYRAPVISQDGIDRSYDSTSYGEDIFTRYISEFISRKSDKPFFIYYPMVLPHAPFHPTPDHSDFQISNDTVDNARYFADMVKYMDKKVGDIVRLLDSLNEREQTIIIFVGDNGTDKRITSILDGKKVKGNKGYTTDTGIHVPLIVSCPKRYKAGTTIDDLVDFTDIFSTVLDVAGIPTPQTTIIDGISFVPQLTNKKSSRHNYIFTDYDAKGRDFPPQTFVHDKRYKLYKDGRFYDYINDPLEQRPISDSDLSRSEKTVRGRLQKIMSNIYSTR